MEATDNNDPTCITGEQIGLVGWLYGRKNYLLMTSSKGEIDPLMGGNKSTTTKENLTRESQKEWWQSNLSADFFANGCHDMAGVKPVWLEFWQMVFSEIGFFLD